MRKRRQLTYSFLLIAGVLVLINILSASFFARLDFTEDKRFTLSKATKKILKELKQPVTLTAYISEKDLPPDYMSARRDFKDILVEYDNLSHGLVKYEIVDPSENDDLKQKAAQAGIQPKPVPSRKDDQYKIQQVYFGVIIKMNEKTEVVPVIQPGSVMEYDLSSAIKKLSVSEKPSIGLLQGNGEPSLGGIGQAYSDLDILYNVEPVYLNDTTYTLNKYRTIAIVNPKDTVPEKYLGQIDRFLAGGGNLFVAVSHVDIGGQGNMGVSTNNIFMGWLKKKGVTIADNAVVDANCGYAGAQQQGYTLQFKFPFFPIINNFQKHPITEGLDAVVFQFASQVNFTGDSSKTFIPLAFTSEKSGTQPLPVYFDANKNWADSDFPLKNIAVAAAVVPKTGKGGKIVVVSNGSFAVNGESQQPNQQPRQLNPGNVNFMVNAIDWLSDDTGLIDLRTKGVKMRMLDQIDDGKKTFLKYLNFFLPILLIIGYGVYRFNRNRIIRMKRMEVRYV